MKLAVLSGKGGTGKTFVSVNLAASIPGAVYVDCDVEEPNGRLFFRPEISETSTVFTKIPTFDATRCVGCRECVNFCKFNALIFLKGLPKVFSDVCHACGGCSLVCKHGAVSETDREVGHLECGQSEDVRVITGILNLGEASGIPVIQAALGKIPADAGTVIVDCPPGSSCAVTESISDADACLIVAEPTAFGFHNFEMVHRLTRLLGKPCFAVINKSEQDYEPLNRYCKENGIPVLMKIPFSKELGEKLSSATVAARELPAFRQLFCQLSDRIREVTE